MPKSTLFLTMLLCAGISFAYLSASAQTTAHGKYNSRGNKMSFRGTTFEPPKTVMDTVTTEDPVTNSIIMKVILKEVSIVKIDGIASCGEPDRKPVLKSKYASIRALMLHSLSADLKELNDGSYILYIKDIVVDRSGRIVYIDYNGLIGDNLSNDVQQRFFDKVVDLAENAIKFEPGIKAGSPVMCQLYVQEMFWKKFKVENHILYEQTSTGAFVPIQ